MTRQKTLLILALLLTALLGGASVQPAFCFSQQSSFINSPVIKQQLSVRLMRIYPHLKPLHSSAKTSSIDTWLGAGEAFARAA